MTAPFFLVWFGISRSAQIALLILYDVTIVYLFAQRAADNLDPTYVAASRTLGASPRGIIVDVYLMGALPEVFGGIRIALAGAWGLEAFSELLGAPKGIGRVIQAMAADMDTQMMVAAIMALAVVAVAFDVAIGGIFGFITQMEAYGAPLREQIARWRKSNCGNVRQFFRRSGGALVEAVSDVSLVIRAHEFVCLIGPSGCGKTTLLQLVAGLHSRRAAARWPSTASPSPVPRPSAGSCFSATASSRGCERSTTSPTASNAAASRRPSASRSRANISSRSGWATSSGRGRANSPAACSSGWRSRPCSPTRRESC